MKINKIWINKHIQESISKKNFEVARFGIALLNREVMLNEYKCKYIILCKKEK